MWQAVVCFDEPEFKIDDGKEHPRITSYVLVFKLLIVTSRTRGECVF